MDMNELKESKYNFFFKAIVGIDFIGYNSFTNSLLEFSPDDYRIVKEILMHPSENSFTKRQSDIYEMLKENGFLINNNFNYLEELRKRFYHKYNDLSLTIAPTLACNFDCIYCFEEKSNDYISEKTQGDLLQFIRDRLPNHGALNVSFFGGEPLLALNIIEHLSVEMKKICKEKAAKLNNNSIITNGYLLTPKVAKKLRSLGITSAQITLDGPPEIHNRRRPLINGKGTFEKILINIKECMNILNIVVRVNIGNDNLEAIFLLQKLLDKEGITNISIYPGHVQAYTDKCNDISHLCIKSNEFIDYKWRFELDQISKGRYTPNYPSLKYGYCIATNPNGFVIAPSGSLFKCWNEISFTESYSIGNISGDSAKEPIKNIEKWSSWSPFDKTACVECKYLPLCMGGCPYIGMNEQNLSCSEYKGYLEEYITLRHALGRIYDVNKVMNDIE